MKNCKGGCYDKRIEAEDINFKSRLITSYDKGCDLFAEILGVDPRGGIGKGLLVIRIREVTRKLVRRQQGEK